MSRRVITKPRVRLTQVDGNVFALIAACRKALLRAGQRERAAEMVEQVMSSGSYDTALQVMLDYVDAD